MLLQLYIPKYVAPEKTGDELFDLINEFKAYREWQTKVKNVREENVRRRKHIESIFPGVDPSTFEEKEFNMPKMKPVELFSKSKNS